MDWDLRKRPRRCVVKRQQAARKVFGEYSLGIRKQTIAALSLWQAFDSEEDLANLEAFSRSNLED
jgi:hypothetical protein